MINAIKEIIDERVVVDIIKTENNLELLLKEDDDGSDISELKITHIPEDSFAFTLDYTSSNKRKRNGRLFKKLSCYLNSKNNVGINKSCDLVIVTKNNDSIKVIVLDLKSKKTTGKRPCVQIENSILFMDYIFSLARFYYDEDNTNSNTKIQYVKALITTRNIQKSTTSRRPSNRNEIKKIPVLPKFKRATVRYSSIAV